MDFTTGDLAVYAGVFAAVVVLGERIARITPTETDNNFFNWLRKLAMVFGIVVPDNPGKSKEPK